MADVFCGPGTFAVAAATAGFAVSGRSAVGEGRGVLKQDEGGWGVMKAGGNICEAGEGAPSSRQRVNRTC